MFFCKWAGVPLAVVLVFALYSNITISSFEAKVYNDLSETPSYDVGLLLGTGKHLNGRINPFYKNRIEAAATLYKSGKIKKILASGDGGTFAKCEPEQMRDDLVKLGVPEKDIVLDYAGFRTLDSIQRCKKVFGTSEVLIISQDFHCRRALFLAEHYEMKAEAYAAKDVKWPGMRKRAGMREIAARTVAMADTKLIGRKAKFYGKPVRMDKGD